MPGQRTTTGLYVDGLAELLRNLGKVSPEVKAELKASAKDAGNILVTDARKHVPTRSGKAARSLKVSVAGNGVNVTGGGSRAPYYPWLDFGGSVGKGRKSEATITLFTTRSGRTRARARTTRARGTGSVVRQFIKGGRYLFPSLERKRAAMKQAMKESVITALRSVGLDVTQ